MTSNAEAFATTLVEDQDFASRLENTLVGLDGDAALEAVSRFAQEHGYSVSPGQAAGLRAAVLSEIGADTELGDAEMDAVSGGAPDGWDDGFQTGQKFAQSLLKGGAVTKTDLGLAGAIGGVVGGTMTAYATFMTKW